MNPAEQLRIEQEFLRESEKTFTNQRLDIDNRKLNVLYVDHNENACNHLKSMLEYAYEDKFSVTTLDSGYQAFKWLEDGHTPEVIISELSLVGMSGLQFLRLIRASDRLKSIPFIFLSHQQLSKNERVSLLKDGADDLFLKPFQVDALAYRIKYLFKIKNFKASDKHAEISTYKIPFSKRLFDIFLSAIALLLMLPILLIVGLIIKLESRGPMFYKSKRVGMGYQIFDLYKFRSMAIDADKNVDQLKHLNLYQSDVKNDDVDTTTKDKNTSKVSNAGDADLKLVTSEKESEKLISTETKKNKGPIFMKFKNDPRVTRFGRFIRKTSIDELPQLINVLIGDISIVGNRPLPIYEAEKLTTDSWSERFIAPAGITGLWQVTKRGKSDMSEEERIDLDNQYARKSSLIFDLKIILKTFPALLQSENA